VKLQVSLAPPVLAKASPNLESAPNVIKSATAEKKDKKILTSTLCVPPHRHCAAAAPLISATSAQPLCRVQPALTCTCRHAPAQPQLSALARDALRFFAHQVKQCLKLGCKVLGGPEGRKEEISIEEMASSAPHKSVMKAKLE
jgi:hypothetical protein